jgi:transcriptional regulator with XRE-family HTH domain
MNEPARQINGALLRQQREAKGWAQTDLATRACLSLRQVRQVEEGGNSSFYSDSVKATAARKIATLLGLPADSAYVQTQTAAEPINPVAASSESTEANLNPVGAPNQTAHTPGPAGADLSSVMTHVAVATADIDPPPPQSLSSDGAESESRSSGFMWIVLLAVAVGAGLLLMPKASDAPPPPSQVAPVDPNPPAPPPMVLPADAAEAAGNGQNPVPQSPSANPAPSAPPAMSTPVTSVPVTPMPNAVSPAPANGPPKTP